MENLEQILKKELGNFEKNLIEFREKMENELSSFKTEMKNEMSGFKTEMKNEMSGFKTEMKDEISGFKTEMKDEMSGFKAEMKNEISVFKTEVNDEIRDRFFVFEQDYGTKIDAMYDIIVLNKEITDEKIEELRKQNEINEFRTIKNAIEIDSLKKSKNSKSKFNSKI